jgi:ankyrin repeat protein
MSRVKQHAHGKDMSLMEAVRINRIDIVSRILKQSGDGEGGVVSGVPNELTPLGKAALDGLYRITKLLLDNNARIGNLLFELVQTDEKEIVQLLVERGARIDDFNALQQQPLALAVQAGQIDNIKYLIERGANLDNVDSFGNTLLHHAINNETESNLDVVKLFISTKADISKADKQNSEGQTPLHVAVSVCNEFVTEFLIGKGADGTVQDLMGRTPLLIALHQFSVAGRTCNTATITTLIRQTVANNIADKTGRSPLMYVIDHFGRPQIWVSAITSLLLDHKADPSAGYTNSVNNNPATIHAHTLPLFQALQSSQPSMVSLLLRYGADIRGVDAWGGTLMHAYIHHLSQTDNESMDKEDTSFMDLLRLYRVDIDAKDYMGHTAMHYAALFNLATHLQYLLDIGARMYTQDLHGLVPRQITSKPLLHILIDNAAQRRYKLNLAFLEASHFSSGSSLRLQDAEVMKEILQSVRDFPVRSTELDAKTQLREMKTQERKAAASLAYLATTPMEGVGPNLVDAITALIGDGEDGSEDGAGEDGAGEDGAGEEGLGEDGSGEEGLGEDGSGEEGSGDSMSDGSESD